MTYDMRSYSKGIISFYCEITGMRQEKLRKASTPCLLENQTTDEELAHEGEMHAFAARILMKCLWLSRLARPDISFAVQRLASRITRWTKWEDRQMLRLVSYLNSTCEYVMRAAVEPDQAPTLLVYTDSDFASCPYTSKSTSGVVFVLRTGSACFPLLWSSKKQSSTARSTTEAELIASPSALFGEALNLHTMVESLTEVHVPVSFQQDNQAAITVIQSGYSAKLRHSGRVHRVNVASIHEQLDQGIFDLDYCETTAQLANGFTKVIGQAECNKLSNNYVSLLTDEFKEDVEIGQANLCHGPRNCLTVYMYSTRGSYWFVCKITTCDDVLYVHVSFNPFCCCNLTFGSRTGVKGILPALLVLEVTRSTFHTWAGCEGFI